MLQHVLKYFTLLPLHVACVERVRMPTCPLVRSAPMSDPLHALLSFFAQSSMLQVAFVGVFASFIFIYLHLFGVCSFRLAFVCHLSTSLVVLQQQIKINNSNM